MRKTKSPRRRSPAPRVRHGAPLRLETLEERIVPDRTPLLGATLPPEVEDSAGHTSTFFITRFEGLTGNITQQVAQANQRLHDAGLDDEAKVVRSLGSQGLLLLRTSHEFEAEELNEDLVRVRGYQYVRTVQGNADSGAVTRIFKGPDDRAVNPMLYLNRNRLDVGPLVPPPPDPSPLTPPTILGNFEGLDSDDNPFLLSPPDTIVAAGPNHVIEMVNIALRVYAKDGTVLLTQTIDQFFAPLGVPTAGDPLVTYDTNANRWYIAAIDGADNSRLLFAVSNTANPLDGFTEMQRIQVAAAGDLADFPKMGFNADSIILEANAFGSGGGNPRVTAILKSSVLDANPATLTQFNSTPAPNFRAMVPATMHGAAPGSDVMFFVQERTYGDGDFVQVVRMTNILSNSPVYTPFDIDVNDYGFNPLAEQPGGQVNTNDTTFLNADWRNGKLVAAHSVGDPGDADCHAAWYLFNAPDSGAAVPSLLQEGRLDFAPGVSTYYPSVAITTGGAIGMTYMQSSPTQFPSTYVTGRSASDPVGTMREGALVAEGEDFLDGFGRAGDYSGVVVDPADGATFWAANEYKAIGPLWSTVVAHFSLGMTVTTTTPANGDIVTTRPTAYFVDFSDPFDPNPAFINVAGFRINNNPASAYTIIDANTIRFTFTVDPVVAQGLQTFDVSANTVRRLGDNDPLQAYSGSFRYDILRMQVVSSVPADGSVTTLPLTSITINLNEPYLASSVGTNDLTLSVGTVTGFTLVDADTITYQVSGIVDEGTLTFGVPAGALTDAFGNPNIAYTASTTLDFGIVPFPVPTTATTPAGSLIFQTSKSGFITPAGDADSFTILVDTGQTLTVIVEPSDNFRSAVSLFATDGGDVLVGSATSAANGQDAVIQTVLVPGSLTAPGAPRNYKVTVTGAAGSTGSYTVRMILNAAAESEDHDGATNNTRATAQSLEGSFVGFNAASPRAERGAVAGNVRGGPQPGEAYVGVRSANFFGGSINRYDANGNLVQSITHPVLDAGVISDVELGPNNILYVGLATNFGGGVASGELAKFDTAGNYLGSVPLPDDNDFGFLYPFGFDVAADGTFWVPQLNSGDLLHVSATGTQLDSFFVGGTPNDAAVRADGQVFVSRADFSDIVQVNPTNGDVTFFAFDNNFNPILLTFTPTGDLWLGDFFGPTRFNAAGTQTSFIDNFGTVDPQVDPSNNLWVTNFDSARVQRFSPAGVQQFTTSTPGGNPIGVAVLGIDSPTPLPAPDLVDFYSFALTAGQSFTAALDVVSGPGVVLELQDAAGNPIALGSASGSLDQAISNFYAPSAGTYYLKVSGGGSVYSLVVTRSADFDTGLNDSFATAQDVVATVSGGRRYVLGHVSAASTAVLDATDSGWYRGNDGFHDPNNPNYVTGLIAGTGEFRDFFTFSPSGLPDGTLTSAQLRVFNPGGGYVSTDPTETYALFDVTTPIGQLVAGGFGQFGIFNDLGTGIAYGSRVVSAADNSTLIAFDLNAAAIADLSAKLSGPFALGGGALTTLAGNADNQVIFAFTGAFQRQLAITLSDDDYYRVNVAAGGSLLIDTSTPAGLAGEYVNLFDPIVYVYDALGNLVASNDNGAADGRNASLSLAGLAAGNYVIRVAPSPLTPAATSGDYVLSIGGGTTTLPPFAVTDTDPVNGALLRVPPTTMTVNFNDTVLVSSLQASDLKIDGVNATAFTVVDGNTVIFTLPGPLPEGLRTVTIAAGALTDLQGTPITAYTGTFFLDFTGPRVTGTSIAPNAVVAPGSVTYQVTFGEAMNVANLSADDFALRGTLRGVDYAAASFSFNGAGTVLTLNYANLPDDIYRLTLVAGVSGGANFTDVVGNALDGEFNGTFPSGNGTPGGNFVIGFFADFTTEAFPTLGGRRPGGSLIYDGSLDRVIAPTGDSDTYTINIDPGQTLTVLVDPAGSPDPQLYGGVGNGSGVNPGGVLLINQNTGSGVLVGDPVTPGGLTGLVFDPSTGVFFGSSIRTSGPTSNLVRIDPDSGALLGSVAITFNGVAISIGDLAIQPGTNTIFAARSFTDGAGLGGLLYTVNKTTGVATFIGDTEGGANGGIAFAPDGSLWQTAFNDVNFSFPSLNKLNPANAARLSTTPLANYYDGLGIRADGTLFATPGGSDALFTINSATGAETFVGATGTGLISDLTFRPPANVVAPTVEVRDAANNLLGTATAGPGLNALLQNVPVTAGGTYRIIVSGGGGTGLYNVKATLNAALESEGLVPGTNNTAATAQNINASVANVTTTLASAGRGGLLGTSDQAGYSASAVAFAFEEITATGTHVLPNLDDTATTIAIPFAFNFYGTAYTSVGFSTNGLITFGGTDASFTNQNLTTSPSLAAIAPFWDDLFTGANGIAYQVLGTAPSRRLVIEWDNATFFGGGSNTLKFEAVLFEGSNAIRFNYLNLSNGGFGSEGTSATVGIKAAGAQGPDRLLLAFNNGPNDFVGSGRSTLISPPVSTPDYYSFTIGAGEVVTVAATGQGVGNLNLELRNSADVVVATGVTAANLTKVINNFAGAAGTYFVRVTGDSNVPYSVVVTKNAAFDTEANNTAATAQVIAGNKGALGATQDASSSLANFESGQQGYTINNNIRGGGAAAGLWHLSTRRGTEAGHSPVTSFYYGSESTGNYDTGAANAGSITSPVISLGAATPINLSFNYILDTEGTNSFFDLAEVQVSANGFASFTTILSSANAAQLAQTTTWLAATANLSAFAGQNIQIRFIFDTVDSLFNDFEGWYVDDVQVATPADPDWYSVTLAAGQTALQVETSTPADGPGQFLNTLNPKIALFDSTGTILIANGVVGGDGRNESILATGLTAGATYKVRVLGEGGTGGEYFLGTTALATPTPTALVDNNNFGFSTRGAWQLVTGGHLGTYRRIAGNGDGSLYAQWQYSQNFTAGTSYGFYVTWVAAPGNATNARYKIFDGAAQIGTVFLDQTRSPNTALVNGSLWQQLFIYTPATTGFHVIRVQVDNSGNGNVVADALFDPPLAVEAAGRAALASLLSQSAATAALDLAFSARGRALPSAAPTDGFWTLLSGRETPRVGASTAKAAKSLEESATVATGLDAAFTLLGERRTRFDLPLRARRGGRAEPLAAGESAEEGDGDSVPVDGAVAEEQPRD